MFFSVQTIKPVPRSPAVLLLPIPITSTGVWLIAASYGVFPQPARRENKLLQGVDFL